MTRVTSGVKPATPVITLITPAFTVVPDAILDVPNEQLDQRLRLIESRPGHGTGSRSATRRLCRTRSRLRGGPARAQPPPTRAERRDRGRERSGRPPSGCPAVQGRQVPTACSTAAPSSHSGLRAFRSSSKFLTNTCSCMSVGPSVAGVHWAEERLHLGHDRFRCGDLSRRCRHARRWPPASIT